MLGVCVASLWAGVAPAQVTPGVIGQTVANAMADMAIAQCLAGVTTMSAEEAHEADGPVQAAVANYWAAASASDNAQLAALFKTSGKSAWVANGVERRVRSVPVTDSYARTPGNVLVEKPIVLVRAKYGRTARGLWEVRTASGSHAGFYLVDFSQGADWRPHRLELLPPNASAPMVSPYCETPGDIEAFYEAAKAIPEKQIEKITRKSVPVTTCAEGADCSGKWERARQWVRQNSAFPLIRDTDTLLLTSGPVYADLRPSYAVVLDPPTSDGRRTIRLRAWCGNWFSCAPTPEFAHQAVSTALDQKSP